MRPSRKWVVRSIFLLSCVGLIGSVILYDGSKLIFCFFSVVIFTVGYLAVRFSSQYAHMFLGIAWFIGFWVKYLFHLMTGHPYEEMHGSFDGSFASWDAVFLVIAIGGTGYLAGRLLSAPIVKPVQARLFKHSIVVPPWWVLRRNIVWLIAALSVLSMLALNHAFGLYVRGYAASVNLPWPLGGLYAWMTDIGFALVLSVLLAWDRQSSGSVMRGFISLCVEGALFSISTLSRGLFLFHSLPPLITEGDYYLRRGRFRPVIIMLCIFVLVGTAVPSASTFMRLFNENAVPRTESELVASKSSQVNHPLDSKRELWEEFLKMTRLLVIDRWTGLEGLMATVSYSEKSAALFAEAAAKRRSYGTVDVYTRKISGSTFTEENAKKYHYATLAGPIAFFYFSDSLITVFIGMALIAVLMSATELLWLWLARDRLLLAMSGFYLALVVLQLSGSLVQAITGPIAVTGIFAGVRLIDFIYRPHNSSSSLTSLEESCSKA